MFNWNNAIHLLNINLIIKPFHGTRFWNMTIELFIVLKKYHWLYDVWHWLNLSPDLWCLCTICTILSYRLEYMSKTASECQLSADWRWNETSKQIALYTSPSEHTLCSQLKKWDDRDSDTLWHWQRLLLFGIFVKFDQSVKRKSKTQYNDEKAGLFNTGPNSTVGYAIPHPSFLTPIWNQAKMQKIGQVDNTRLVGSHHIFLWLRRRFKFLAKQKNKHKKQDIIM